MLTAAKRGVPEGSFVYIGEGWSALGLVPSPPFEFTLEEFLRLTGQLKQTRKRRSGDVTNVHLTHWAQWQKEWRRDAERERMSRKRRESHANTMRTPSERDANEKRTEKRREEKREPKTLGKGRSSAQTKNKNHDPRVRRSDDTSRYTGCRQTRGTGGFGYVPDPLGIDFPPDDWPYPPPTNEQVLEAVRAVRVGASDG